MSNLGFTIRPATLDDVSALASLHVQTFRETHGGGPTKEIREGQWAQRFAEGKGYICLAEDSGVLIGFASGLPYELDDLPYDGRLEKIYVLRARHRQGIGLALSQDIVRTFLDRGITSMVTFSEANNPSLGFFEHLGGQRLFTPKGEFHGGYGWSDIRPILVLAN